MSKYVVSKGTVKRSLLPLVLVIFGIGIVAPFFSKPGGTDALSGSQFKPGRIIDDAVFYDKNAMSSVEIQQFLNSKVPVCDTNHAKSSSSNDSGPPYTCLKNYRQDTNNIAPESGLCNGYQGAVNESAATIIAKVAWSCGINPQVILVMLQKEQALITDTWPWDIQYEKAMGAFCPDTAPCNPAYKGFFYQVYYGAHRFKVYAANPDSFNYKAGRNNTILWHPNTACGTSNVFIENQATASLYIYTPYRPNQAALNNLYGTGDSCSSYGNRNFWVLFNDWFGSTLYHSFAADITENKLFTDAARTQEIALGSNVASGVRLYGRVKAKNVGGLPWNRSYTRIGTRSPFNHSSVFADDSWISAARPAEMKEATVNHGQIGTFEYSFITPDADKLYIEQFQLLAEGRKWMEYRSRFDVSVRVSNPYNATIEALVPFEDSTYANVRSDVITKDEDSYWQLRVKNTGYQTWSNANTRLGTSNPKNRLSSFSDASWISGGRPAQLIEASVAPGQIGTFRYKMSNQGKSRTYLESFQVLVEGVAWMPSAHFTHTVKFFRNTSQIHKGLWLSKGEQLRFGNEYRLVLQGDGNLVLYNASGKPVWYTGIPASKFVLQGDGNLVLYNASGKPLWSAGKPGTVLILQGDGNLVLYNASGKPLWSTSTSGS